MAISLYSKRNNGIHSERGFTLAELLIVVAIIAVLTAIAIPVFTTQLERSREATDISNVRAAASELIDLYLTNPYYDPNDHIGNGGFAAERDFPGGVSGAFASIAIEARQRQEDWQGPPGYIVLRENGEEVGYPIPAVVYPKAYIIYYVYNENKIFILEEGT